MSATGKYIIILAIVACCFLVRPTVGEARDDEWLAQFDRFLGRDPQLGGQIFDLDSGQNNKVNVANPRSSSAVSTPNYSNAPAFSDTNEEQRDNDPSPTDEELALLFSGDMVFFNTQAQLDFIELSQEYANFSVIEKGASSEDGQATRIAPPAGSSDSDSASYEGSLAGFINMVDTGYPSLPPLKQENASKRAQVVKAPPAAPDSSRIFPFVPVQMGVASPVHAEPLPEVAPKPVAFKVKDVKLAAARVAAGLPAYDHPVVPPPVPAVDIRTPNVVDASAEPILQSFAAGNMAKFAPPFAKIQKMAEAEFAVLQVASSQGGFAPPALPAPKPSIDFSAPQMTVAAVEEAVFEPPVPTNMTRIYSPRLAKREGVAPAAGASESLSERRSRGGTTNLKELKVAVVEQQKPAPTESKASAPAASKPAKEKKPVDENNIKTFSELLAVKANQHFQFGQATYVWAGDGRPYLVAATGKLERVALPAQLAVTNELGEMWLSPEAALGSTYLEVAPKILSFINFRHDSTAILKSSRKDLDLFAISLNTPALAKHRLVIVGHTNSLGNPTYNLGLSKRRALSVSRYLKKHHSIGAERIILHGYGDQKPLADNATRHGLQVNRRVEFVLIEPPQESENLPKEEVGGN